MEPWHDPVPILLRLMMFLALEEIFQERIIKAILSWCMLMLLGTRFSMKSKCLCHFLEIVGVVVCRH